MSKLQDIKMKAQCLGKQNSLVLSSFVEKSNNLKKSSAFPPNQKINSGLSISKNNQKGFKKIKSLSPVAIEHVESRGSKEIRKLNTTFLKLKLDSNNAQEKENFPMNVEDLIKDMQMKMESIDRRLGNSTSSRKVREILAVFDEFSQFFHNFGFFLHKFKRMFEQIYLKNILLANEIEELKKTLKESKSLFPNDKDSSRIPETEEKLSQPSLLPQVSSDSDLQKLPSDENLKKIPLLKRHSHISILRRNETLNLTHHRSAEALDAIKPPKVPKLSVNDKLLQVQGFQDEFMQNAEDFSESWRVLIKEQKRFD